MDPFRSASALQAASAGYNAAVHPSVNALAWHHAARLEHYGQPFLNPHSPLALHARGVVAPGRAAAHPAFAPDSCLAPGSAKWVRGPCAEEDRSDVITDGMHGTIKSFHTAKGCGFIDCSYLKERGLRDAFLSALVSPFKVGDVVVFSLRFNQRGQPQVVDGSLLAVDCLQGQIRRFDDKKGYGFIECAALKKRSLNDVFLLRTEMASFQVGDRVQFAVRFNDRGQPQAFDLRAAESLAGAASDAEAPSPSAAAEASDQSVEHPAVEDPEAVSAIEVTVEATAETVDSVDISESQPAAEPAQVLRSASSTSASPSSPTPAVPEPAREVEIEDLFDLQGRIKSFSEKSGYGFIDSAYLKEHGYGDAFLHKLQLMDFRVGSRVRFTATFNNRGQPQALDLRADVDEEDMTRPDVDIDKLVGRIKSFNAKTGYGFIDCPYLKEHGLFADVFLMKDEIGSYKVGDAVTFSMTRNEKGQPQARNLMPVVSDEDLEQRKRLNQYLSQQHLCIICQEMPIGVVYSQCGHGCVCRDCSAMADARADGSLNKCPVCRKPGPRSFLFLA